MRSSFLLLIAMLTMNYHDLVKPDLQVCEFTEDFRSGMLDFQVLEDGGAVVGDGDVAHIVHKHLVQTHRTQRRFHDISDGLAC